jgi:hypothetical protein
VRWACSLDEVKTAAAEDFGSHVAPLLDPFVALLGQDGADEADDGVAAGEDADDVGAAADFLVQAFLGVVGPDLLPDFAGEGGEGEEIFAGGFEVPGALGSEALSTARSTG